MFRSFSCNFDILSRRSGACGLRTPNLSHETTTRYPKVWKGCRRLPAGSERGTFAGGFLKRKSATLLVLIENFSRKFEVDIFDFSIKKYQKVLIFLSVLGETFLCGQPRRKNNTFWSRIRNSHFGRSEWFHFASDRYITLWRLGRVEFITLGS
jgi:hypothetical protein